MDKEFIENPVIAYEKLKEENERLKNERTADLVKQIDELKAENERLKEDIMQAHKDWEEKKNLAYELACKNERLKKALEEIREICKCSKETNCEECPKCGDCEELCVNDENLQDIITDKINSVIQTEESEE